MHAIHTLLQIKYNPLLNIIKIIHQIIVAADISSRFQNITRCFIADRTTSFPATMPWIEKPRGGSLRAQDPWHQYKFLRKLATYIYGGNWTDKLRINCTCGADKCPPRYYRQRYFFGKPKTRLAISRLLTSRFQKFKVCSAFLLIIKNRILSHFSIKISHLDVTVKWPKNWTMVFL